MTAPALRGEIRRVFGPAALEWGLFYQNAPALRFELSSDGRYVEMFTQAYDRAREILDVVFDGSRELVVVLSQPEGDTMLGHLSAFRSLRSCEIHIPRPYETWMEPTGPEWENVDRAFLAFTGGRELLMPLLWGVLAAELGIRPRLTCEVYVADLARGILAHPYDDRGMDVIGPNQALLRDLHRRFNPWLLDYDRERMDAFFAGS